MGEWLRRKQFQIDCPEMRWSSVHCCHGNHSEVSATVQPRPCATLGTSTYRRPLPRGRLHALAGSGLHRYDPSPSLAPPQPLSRRLDTRRRCSWLWPWLCSWLPLFRPNHQPRPSRHQHRWRRWLTRLHTHRVGHPFPPPTCDQPQLCHPVPRCSFRPPRRNAPIHQPFGPPRSFRPPQPTQLAPQLIQPLPFINPTQPFTHQVPPPLTHPVPPTPLAPCFRPSARPVLSPVNPSLSAPPFSSLAL